MPNATQGSSKHTHCLATEKLMLRFPEEPAVAIRKVFQWLAQAPEGIVEADGFSPLAVEECDQAVLIMK